MSRPVDTGATHCTAVKERKSTASVTYRVASGTNERFTALEDLVNIQRAICGLNDRKPCSVLTSAA